MKKKKFLMIFSIFIVIAASGIVLAFIKDRIRDYIISNIDDLAIKKTEFLTVGKNQEFITLQEAVDHANNGSIIVVYPGVYEEAVTVNDKTLSIIGVDRESCVLKYPNGDYYTPPLEMGSGNLANLTIHAVSQEQKENAVAKSYALHTDYDISRGNKLFIKNVRFINDDYHVAGVGLRENFKLEFVDCEFISCMDFTAFYCHDDPENKKASNQQLKMENCRFENNGESATIVLQSQEEKGSQIICEWINNEVINQKSDNYIYIHFWKKKEIGNGWMGMSYWRNSCFSRGNSIDLLNF